MIAIGRQAVCRILSRLLPQRIHTPHQVVDTMGDEALVAEMEEEIGPHPPTIHNLK
jgi:hypothetical protein